MQNSKDYLSQTLLPNVSIDSGKRRGIKDKKEKKSYLY